MKNKPPYMVKVGDFLLSRFSQIQTILEINDTEESISFYTGMSKIGPASNDPTRSVVDVRREYIYLKKEDRWIFTGHDIPKRWCNIDSPIFYREITKQMDREVQVNKLLE